MGGGNGAKSKQARERALKNAPKDAKSQLKQNEAAKNLKCNVCFQTFLLTTRAKALEEHASNKHSGKDKSLCFPGTDWTAV